MHPTLRLPCLGLGLIIAANAHASCGLEADPAQLDQDWNGALSREEVRGSVLEPVFDRVDGNGDGSIGQPEFAARCSSIGDRRRNPWATDTAESAPPATQRAVSRKLDRQQQRQQGRVERRLDRETDQAVDQVVGKALNNLFD